MKYPRNDLKFVKNKINISAYRKKYWIFYMLICMLNLKLVNLLFFLDLHYHVISVKQARHFLPLLWSYIFYPAYSSYFGLHTARDVGYLKANWNADFLRGTQNANHSFIHWIDFPVTQAELLFTDLIKSILHIQVNCKLKTD